MKESHSWWQEGGGGKARGSGPSATRLHFAPSVAQRLQARRRAGSNRACLTPRRLDFPPALPSSPMPFSPRPTPAPLYRSGTWASQGPSSPASRRRGPRAGRAGVRGQKGRRGSREARNEAQNGDDRGRKVEGALTPSHVAPRGSLARETPPGPARTRPPCNLSSARPNLGAMATGTLRRPRGARRGRVSRLRRGWERVYLRRPRCPATQT